MVRNIKIGGLNISRMGLRETADLVLKKAREKEGLKVSCCSLNDLVMVNQDDEFRRALSRIDIQTADGMPLVWFLKYKTGKGERVYGPDLMSLILKKSSSKNIGHLFLGDSKNKKPLMAKLKSVYPGIKIKDYLALPIKNRFTKTDYIKVSKRIEMSQAEIVWVGLGSKKQVMMADELSKKLSDRVYLTVGAAFDFLSGTKKQCPKLIRSMGGEWLFRWVNEPKRLTKRYLEIIKFVFNNGLNYMNDKK